MQETAADVLRDRFGCTGFVAHWTEGRTVVVEGAAPAGIVLLKASAESDVRDEVHVCRFARHAGCDLLPEVLDAGWHPELPGGHWFAMRHVGGIAWRPGDRDKMVLAGLAAALFQIHSLRLCEPASSWTSWVLNEVAEATAALEAGGYLTASQSRSLQAAYQRVAPMLDRVPTSLVHADLDPGEVFIDAATAEIRGIVDWGDSIVGDPLLDLARFAAGGPAGDDPPARLQPPLISAYEQHAGTFTPEHHRRLALYRLLWSIRHAHSYLGDPDERSWTPGLVAQAIGRLDLIM